jgi:fructose-1,6-bisphosphatase/inositol monophosphatase family enzyme
LAAVLICAEAGAVIAEANDEDLMTIDTDARRRPVIASSPEMLASLMASRRQ